MKKIINITLLIGLLSGCCFHQFSNHTEKLNKAIKHKIAVDGIRSTFKPKLNNFGQ